jgi:hypothetical protein
MARLDYYSNSNHIFGGGQHIFFMHLRNDIKGKSDSDLISPLNFIDVLIFHTTQTNDSRVNISSTIPSYIKITQNLM